MSSKVGAGYMLILTEEEGHVSIDVSHYESAEVGAEKIHPSAMVAHDVLGLFNLMVEHDVLQSEDAPTLTMSGLHWWSLEASDDEAEASDPDQSVLNFSRPMPAFLCQPFQSYEDVLGAIRGYLDSKEWCLPDRIDDVVICAESILRRVEHHVLRLN